MSHVLDADLLRTFVAIVDAGGFSAAGDRVGRTPSAISMQVKKLEETLGRSLFLRDGRKVSLTSEGEMLLSDARRILKMHESTLARFVAPEMTGVVSIGTPDEYAQTFLPAALGHFSRSHPNVQVEVVCGSSRDLYRSVQSGELDLTLVTHGHSGEDVNSAEIIFEEALVWIGAVDGDAWTRRPLPIALADPACAWRIRATRGLAAAGLEWRLAYSSVNYAGQRAAVQADLAVAPAPSCVVEPSLRVLGVAEGLPPLGSYQVAMHRAADRGGKPAEALAAHVRAAFAGSRSDISSAA